MLLRPQKEVKRIITHGMGLWHITYAGDIAALVWQVKKGGETIGLYL